MANGLLSRIAEGAKSAASESVAASFEGKTPAGGLVGSIFRGAIGGMLNTTSRAEQASDDSNIVEQAGELASKINPLVTYFANITENVQLIAYHIGAQITTMKDIKEDSKQSLEKAARAKEEAETEDAVPAPAPAEEEQASPWQKAADQYNKKVEEKEEESGGVLKQFGGLDFEGIVKSFGAFIGEALFDIGFHVLTKLFPVGLIVSLVAAVGYGIYKYFTDDEFQKTVDDAFNTAKQFVIENVFDPFINGVKRLVTGAIEFLGEFWQAVKNVVGRAYNYVAEKAEAAKEAVVSGAKSVGSKISSAFRSMGFGGGNAAPPPPPPPPAKSAAPSSGGGYTAPPTESAGAAAPAPKPAAAAAEATAAAPAPAPQKDATPSPTGAPTGDASKLDTVVTKASGVDLSGIVPALKERMAGFASEFFALTGKKIMITSGFRSPEKQKALYAANPTYAAKPGASPHEVGTAFDANSKSGDLDRAEQLGLFAKYKLFRPLWPPNRSSGIMEAWHVEPLERKKLASMGDGGVVAGGSNASVDPGSGKPIPTPASPQTGKALGSASTTNAAINEKRQKDAGGSKTVIVNAQQNVHKTVNINPTIAGAEREDSPAFN